MDRSFSASNLYYFYVNLGARIQIDAKRMELKDNLIKMRTEYTSPVSYFLSRGNEEIFMNSLINREINIEFTGIINCIACGRKTKKAFGQGFCYPCFMNSPLNSECILKPELCQAHEKGGRDPEWEETNHNKPHYVYLALTSGVKVGVTREDQIPTRWIDQGAWKALKFAFTPYRKIAGLIEVNLKKHMADKTNWQKMLKNEMDYSMDILIEKEKAAKLLDNEFIEYLLPGENEVYTFEYPVLNYPEKVYSINLDKDPLIQGRLSGIRGQYLIFEDSRVVNIRKFSGYEIILNF